MKCNPLCSDGERDVVTGTVGEAAKVAGMEIIKNITMIETAAIMASSVRAVSAVKGPINNVRARPHSIKIDGRKVDPDQIDAADLARS